MVLKLLDYTLFMASGGLCTTLLGHDLLHAAFFISIKGDQLRDLLLTHRLTTLSLLQCLVSSTRYESFIKQCQRARLTSLQKQQARATATRRPDVYFILGHLGAFARNDLRSYQLNGPIFARATLEYPGEFNNVRN